MGMGRPSYSLELAQGCLNGYGQAKLHVRVGSRLCKWVWAGLATG